MTAPEPRPLRRYRATVRARLALTYSALLTGSGIVILAVVYVFMRFVPVYAIEAAPSTPASTNSGPTPAYPLTGEVASEGLPLLQLNSAEQILNLLLVISVVMILLLAVAGVAIGWIVAGRMLEPLHHINQAVRQAANGDLGHRIGLHGPHDEISELAGNFDDMLSRLERSFAASRRFASNASHELRTPLATTRAMLDVQIARLPEPADRVVFDRLRTMNERSVETVEALLDLAQIESSSNEIELVDLAEIARDAVAGCADEAVERGVRVELHLGPALAFGAPVLIRQLMTNLIQNAIRHNRDEAGCLHVATRSTPSEGTARIEVVNSGASIDPELVNTLVEPFTRGSGRTSEASAKGRGLGLSIVRAIVDRLNGSLELDARENGGLRVVVALPAAEPGS